MTGQISLYEVRGDNDIAVDLSFINSIKILKIMKMRVIHILTKARIGTRPL